jgi:hypothetical protein
MYTLHLLTRLLTLLSMLCMLSMAAAYASPITYEFTGIASGDLLTLTDDFVFDSLPMLVSINGDTANVETTTFGIPAITTGLTGTILIDGSGTGAFGSQYIGTGIFISPPPLYIFYDNDPLSPTFETVGFGNTDVGDLLDYFGTGLGPSYSLEPAPVVSVTNLFSAQFAGVQLDTGSLTIDDVASPATYLTVPAPPPVPAPVPEPSSLILFGSGLAVMALAWRRKSSR